MIAGKAQLIECGSPAHIPPVFQHPSMMASTTIQPKNKRRALVHRVWRIAVLALAVWAVVAWVAARALIVQAEMLHAEAIVVLSGSSTYLERTEQAARLFHEGHAPKIILTNDGLQSEWSSAEQRNPFYFERAVEALRRAGVPAESIETLPQVVSSTYDEARLLREYATTHGLHSILVVTSSYHSRRALWTLRRVMKDDHVLIGLSAPPTGQQTPQPATWWWHARGWRMVAGEYVKLIYYYLRVP
jgi:uncharacterized SAM-binding protein YcdF (DUF218 family)